MADTRQFFKTDVGYFMNPKVNAIRIASGNAGGNAILAHLASVAYCAQHRTDGVVPPMLILAMVGATPEDGDLLEQGGLWHYAGHDCPDCPPVSAGEAYVHDFLEHNESRDSMSRRSSAGKKAAQARWNANGNAVGNADRITGGTAERNAEKRREEKRRTNAHPSSEHFDAFWAIYPKKVAKKAALKKFETAVADGVDPAHIIAGAKAYAGSVEGSDPKFIKQPDGWLNAGRWEDEPPLPAAAGQGGMSEEEARDRRLNPWKYQ